MRKLLEGIRQFQERVYPHKRDLFQELDRGQSPATLFITCSDSRIDPNLITATEPGELFVIRNAGNIVPPYDDASGSGEAATIEYAMQALQVQDVVVCGHSRCGAMAAVLDPDSCDGLPMVSSWVQRAEQVRRRVGERHGNVSADRLSDLIIQENVLMQLENVQTHPSVRDALASGRLQLHGWVYRIADGQVLACTADRSAFEPVDAEFAANERP